MTKKVYELAKEMGIASKDLIAKAAENGIELKSHMSNVTADVEAKLRGNGEKKATTKTTATGKKIPVGKPIVDEAFLANKKKPPVGKPVVDEAMLARRQKERTEDDAERTVTKQAPADKPVEKASATKAEPKKTERTPVEKPASKAIEKTDAKPTPKKEEKKPQMEEKKPAVKTHTETGAGKKEDRKPAGSRIKRAGADAPRPQGPRIIRKAGEIDNTRKNSTTGKNADDKRSRTSSRNEHRNERRSGGRPSAGTNAQNKSGGRRKPAVNENRGSNRVPKAAPAGGTSGGKNRSERRGNNNHRHDDRNKFAKFDRKSLEKKERKKYNKPKDVEPEIEEEVLPEGTIKINVPITVAGFCEQAEVSTSKVIMTLMKLGVMANINQNIDEDTLMVLAEELGLEVVIGKVEEEIIEEGIEHFEDREKDLKDRSPIITVMGHVDHGKTSLLDAIRNTNVTSSESGGITQHIGASEVSINGQKIVFLDTPGHEAFTAMRARGAHITDIAVLVVAADDSVKPQTIESISHAKAAGVPIIVAINKMDKPGANPDMVKKDLADQGVLVEDWGGDVISVPVSAKTGEGITNLLEMILLQAEMMELKANPNRLAHGSVIEARLDKAKGPVASLLILNGTLQAGQSIVAGTCSGRIRRMTDDKGNVLKKAGPATAVEILGLTDVPQAGDEFDAVRDDKTAREIAENRKEKLREEVLAKNSSMTLDKLFSQIQEGETKELNLVIKADVQGSVGAMISSLEKLNNDEVKVNVVHSGVGTVSESDIMLAETSDAVIIGFNVRPSTAIASMAEQHGVELRLYRVIYDVINDVEAAMKGMLDPEFKEEVLGKAEVRNTFKVPGVGIVAGAYITEGKVARNKEIRLVRDGIVVHEGKISSLKRFKDDAKEVNQGYECGIGIEDYNDIKEGDIIECFTMVEIERN
ncbi:translation initiation factor IF-2 [Eubacterium sp. AB3007]|uniref:translation initiation factor IF-2 n=1 Tax=Eubacterium sp. AB3007 TaxID=1392487 RepID=UPI00048907C1|nr:translation initiation factor IF-2 [Eubacterium sp. AB3007]